MKPVEQTKTGGPDLPHEKQGNCFQASVASLFEIPLEEAPETRDEPMWYLPVERWALARGYFVMWNERAAIPGALGLKAMKSFKGAYLHSVVSRGPEIVWDPSPDRDEGQREEPDGGPEYTYFFKLDPAA